MVRIQTGAARPWRVLYRQWLVRRLQKSAIPYWLKKQCVEAANSGNSFSEIYRDVFQPEHPGMNFETFRHKLRKWKRAELADETTLECGTYPGFIPNGATVQVDKNGEIVQAWIKEVVDSGQWDRLLDAIREHTEPAYIEPAEADGIGMLEIPLYDMHLPLSDYSESVAEIVGIIHRQTWDEINLIVGQDMLHNDDMRGRTASGRQIEQVDMVSAWDMARQIWYSIIEAAIRNAKTVRLIYSVGNHDESMAWAFVQLLKERYPQVEVDDTFHQRKRIWWERCFIGITHGNNARSNANDLRGQFTIEFPIEFANSDVREIHAGHVHHETANDLYGVVIRRLSRGGTDDTWSNDEGYVGSTKRFMLFEWMPGRLKAIDYV